MTKIKTSVKHFRQFRRLRQKGSVLFVSLMILLMLTVVGLSSMNNSIVELNIASNIQEKAIAYQASLAGLDSAMCLVNTADDPFTKYYDINPAISDGTGLEVKFQADNTSELNIFKDQTNTDITNTACSISSGQINDGTHNTIASLTGEILDVQIKQVAFQIDCPRETNASSTDDIKCHNYVLRSRYQYSNTAASVTTWAGVSRQVPAN
jgi:Tfp pilus assembly protein PilX